MLLEHASTLTPVIAREAAHEALPMLVDSIEQTGDHACVERAVAFRCQDV